MRQRARNLGPVGAVALAVLIGWAGWTGNVGAATGTTTSSSTTTTTIPCDGSVSSGGSASETTTSSTSSTTSTTAPGGGRCPKEDSDPNDQPKVTVLPNQTYDHQYGSITGVDTTTEQTQDYDPATCRMYQEIPCNVIPIDFQAPNGLKKADTFLATITVTWANAAGVCGIPVQNCAEGDELDLFLWPNPEGTKNTTVAIEKDANADEPKTLHLDLTTGLFYQFVLDHTQGTGNPGGYHVHIVTQYIPFNGINTPSGAPPTTEASAPSTTSVLAATPPTTVPTSPAGPSASPTIGSPAGSPTPETTPASAPTGLAATSAPGEPDPSLSGLAGTNVDSAIAAGVSLFKPPPPSRPPSPVGGTPVALALGVVPIALLGIGAVFLRRRRPIALTLKSIDVT